MEKEFRDKVLGPLASERIRLKGCGQLDAGKEIAGSEYETAMRQFTKKSKIQDLKYCGRELLRLGEARAAQPLVKKDTLACAECEVRLARKWDREVKYPHTAQRCLNALRSVQRAMSTSFNNISFIVQCLEFIYTVAEPLALTGGAVAAQAAELLLWCGRAMDAILPLATTEYLPVRARLYSLAAQATAAAHRSPDAVINEFAEKVAQLRKTEAIQLPLPDKIEYTLKTTERDIAALRFKLAAKRDPLLSTSADENSLRDRAHELLLKHSDRTEDHSALLYEAFLETEETDAGIAFASLWLEELNTAHTNEQMTRAARKLVGTKYFEQCLIESSNELHTLKCTNDYMQWLEEGSRQVATDLAARSDAAKKSAKVARREKNNDENAIVATSVVAEILADEASQAASDALRLPSKPSVPVRRARSLIDALANVDQSSEIRLEVALFVWQHICLPVRELLEHGTTTTVKQVALVGNQNDDLNPVTMFFVAAWGVFAVFQDTDDALLVSQVALSIAAAVRQQQQQNRSQALLRRALQALRAALSIIRNQRADATLSSLHAPVEAADQTALSTQAVTTAVSAAAARSAKSGRLGAHGYGASGIFGAGSGLDALDQALAAADFDLCHALADLEYVYGQTCKRLVSACRHNLATCGIVLCAVSAHTKSRDTLTQALDCFRNAAERENKLLKNQLAMRQWTKRHSFVMNEEPQVSETLPAPQLIDRSQRYITMRPRTWLPPDSIKSVDHVRLFGKPLSAGTDVSLTNINLPGLGVPLAYDAKSGITTECAVVSDLAPGETYIFAVAAFDSSGNVLGSIGLTSEPIEALSPLPLPLCYELLASTANTSDLNDIAATAAREVYCGLVDVHDFRGHRIRSGALDRAPLAQLYAFIRCAKILAELPDNGALPAAYIPGILTKATTSSPDSHQKTVGPLVKLFGDGFTADATVAVSAQLSQYTRLSVLLCGLEVAASVADDDPDVLLDTIWRAYNAMVPLLNLRAERWTQPLLRPLAALHQALWLVLPNQWDPPLRKVYAILTRRLSVLLARQAYEPTSVARNLILSLPPALMQAAISQQELNLDEEGTTSKQKSIERKDEGADAKAVAAEYIEEDELECPDPKTWPIDGSFEQEALWATLAADPNFADTSLRRLRHCVALPLVSKLPLSAISARCGLEWHKDHGHTNSLADTAMCLRAELQTAPLDSCKEVLGWLDGGNVKLISLEELRPVTRRILEDESLTEAIAAAELAATAVSLTPQVAATSRQKDSLAVEEEHPPHLENKDEAPHLELEKESPVYDAAVAAAKETYKNRLPYLDKAEDITVAKDESKADEVFQQLAQNIVADATDRSQLLWLADIELSLGLAKLSALMNDRWRRIFSLSDQEEQPEVSKFDLKSLSMPSVEAFGMGDGLLSRVVEILPHLATPDAEVEEEDIDDSTVEDRDRGDFSHTDTLAAVADEATRVAVAESIQSGTNEIEDDKNANDSSEETVEKSEPSAAKQVSDIICHLSRAIVRARWSRSWRHMATSCAHLRNALSTLWLSPFAYIPKVLNFHDQSQLDPMPLVAAADALLDFTDLLHSGHALAFAGNESFVIDLEPPKGEEQPPSILAAIEVNNAHLLIGGEASECGQDCEVRPDDRSKLSDVLVDSALADLDIDRDIIVEICLIALRALACARRWDRLVALSRRVTRNEVIAVGLAREEGALTGQYLRDAHTLAAFAQDEIIKRSKTRCRRADKALAQIETELVAATSARIAKRRGRQAKLRGGDADKTKEEFALEDKRDRLNILIARLRAQSQVAEHYKTILYNEAAEMTKSRSVAGEALDACRRESGAEVIASYERAERLMREIRTPLLLAQTLQDHGDKLLADSGSTKIAIICWHEAVDSLCSALDASLSWREVLAEYDVFKKKKKQLSQAEALLAVENDASDDSTKRDTTDDFPELTNEEVFQLHDLKCDSPSVGTGIISSLGVIGCLLGGTLLGKIALFGSRGELDSRFERSRFAAVLFRACFAATLPHPGVLAIRSFGGGTQRVNRGQDVLFALYDPESLSPRPLPSLFSSSSRLSVLAACRSLRFCILTLICNDEAVKALPMCCLLEYIAKRYRYDVRATAAAKALRLLALARAGIVDAAASVLATLLTGNDMPRIQGAYAGLSSEIAVSAASEHKSGNFPFYGLEPYDSTSLPEAEQNVRAIAWIGLKAPDSSDREIHGECKQESQNLQNRQDSPRSVASEPQPTIEHLFDDFDSASGMQLFSKLPRGCGGLTNASLATAYGASVLRDIALARAELLLQIGTTGFINCRDGGDSTVRAAADSIATELMTTVIDGAWTTVEEKLNQSLSESESYDEALLNPKLSWSDALTVARCLDLRRRVADADGSVERSRKYASAGITFLANHPLDPKINPVLLTSKEESAYMSPDDAGHALDAGSWLDCRVALARSALSQSRVQDALAYCETGIKEAEAVRGGVWFRRLSAIRCAALTRGGSEPAIVLAEVHHLLEKHRSANAMDLDYVSVLTFAASLRREIAFTVADSIDAGKHLAAAHVLLKSADLILTTMATDSGWCAWTANFDRNDQDHDEEEEKEHFMEPPRSPSEVSVVAFDEESDDVVTDYKSVKTNLYIPAVRLLPKVRLALAENLLDIIAAISVGTSVESFGTATEVQNAALKAAESALSAIRLTTAKPSWLSACILFTLGRARRIVAETPNDENQNIQCSFKSCVTALTMALDIAASKEAGHNLEFMREITLELLRIYAQQPSEDEMRVAMYYLQLAARLNDMNNKLRFELAASIDRERLPERARRALTAIDIEELKTFDTSAALVRYLVALRTEVHLPGGLLDDVSYRGRDLAARIHTLVMYPYIEKYRRECCFQEKLTPQEFAPPQNFVCVQWYVADSSKYDGNFDDDQGIHPVVEAIVLLGTVASDERFSRKPLLLKLHPTKLDDLATMHHRIASVRYALQRTSRSASPEQIEDFKAILSELFAFLNPKSNSMYEDCGYCLSCNIETLTLLEDFFNDRQGLCTQHEKLCGFLRSVWS